MSQFDTIYSDSAWPNLVHTLGQTVTYVTAPDAVGATTSTDIEAVVSGEQQHTMQLDRRTELITTRVMTITTDDTSATGGIATPETNATVIIDSVEWAIEAVTEGAGRTAALHLKKIGPVTVGREVKR